MSDYDKYDKYRMTAGFICKIFMVAQGRNSLSASHCLDDIERISKLVQGTYDWGPKTEDYSVIGRTNYNKYIMHTLLLALRPMVAETLFSQMPEDEQDMLKQAILASQLCPKPTLDDVRKEIEQCKRKIQKHEFNQNTNEKDVLPCIRNIDECARLVAERWDIAQEEMHKWSELLGVPYDDSMIQEDGVPIKRKKEQSVNSDEPSQQNIAILGASVTESEFAGGQVMPVEVADPKQVRRRGRPKGSKNKPKPRAAESPIPGQKLKKIPTNGQGKSKQADVLYTADGRELWSLGKLALALGMADEKTFTRKKSNFLYRHKKDEDYEKLKKIIQSWFEKRGTSVYFRAENIETLKKLFGPTVTKHRAKKVEESVAENPVGMPVPTAEEQVAHVEPVVYEKPTDMVAVKGADAYLTKLKKLYEAANAEWQKQQGLSEEYAAMAKTATTNKEQAAQDAEAIKASMKEYQEIKGDLALAEEGLRVATEHLKEQQNRLLEWMAQNEQYLGK